jgi:transposase InsO family protein
MNLIDDFTSYVWTLPLRTKSEAILVFRGWLAAVHNQSGHRLTYLITDNGELSSRSMTAFCSEQGITHHFTAPYTSAHNGRAERLHRTLFEKAQMMRIACEAPPLCGTNSALPPLSLPTFPQLLPLMGEHPMNVGSTAFPPFHTFAKSAA